MRSRLALLSVLPAVVVACVAPHVWAPHEANASSGSPSYGLADPVVDSASAVDTNAIIVVSTRSYSVPPGGGLPIASHVEALDGAVQPLSRNDLKGLSAPSTALLRPDPPLSPTTDYVLVVENALTPNPGGPPVYETKKVPFRTGTGPRAITPLQIAECGQPSLRRYPSITPRACCEPEPGTCAGGTCHFCAPSELVSREVRSIVWSGGSTSKSVLQHLLVVETNRTVDEESYEWRLEEGKRVYDLHKFTKSVAVPMATCESMCVRAKTVDLLTGDEGISEPLCFSTTLALEGPVPACGQAATLLSRDTCTPEPPLTAVATSCGIGAGGYGGATTWDGSGGTSGCGDPTGPSGGTSGAPPPPPPPKAPVCAPGGGGAAGAGAGGGGGVAGAGGGAVAGGNAGGAGVGGAAMGEAGAGGVGLAGTAGSGDAGTAAAPGGFPGAAAGTSGAGSAPAPGGSGGTSGPGASPGSGGKAGAPAGSNGAAPAAPAEDGCSLRTRSGSGAPLVAGFSLIAGLLSLRGSRRGRGRRI